jgi:hypothetical protein
VLNLIIVSYRDDHAAAIARAEALERELAVANADRDRLRDELARVRAQRFPLPVPMSLYARPPRVSGAALALRVGIVAAIVGVAVLAAAVVHAPPPRSHIEVVPLPAITVTPVIEPDVREAISRCIDDILMRDREAPCRAQLPILLQDHRLSRRVRAALAQWLALEQRAAEPAERAVVLGELRSSVR